MDKKKDTPAEVDEETLDQASGGTGAQGGGAGGGKVTVRDFPLSPPDDEIPLVSATPDERDSSELG
jgi:hypothetical protein